MKSRLIVAFLLLTLVSTVGYATGDPTFSVKIIQNGKSVDIKHGVAKLKKQAFAVEIEMSKKMGILVAASQKSKLYKAAMKNIHIHDLSLFAEKGMVEEKFNTDKSILLSDKQPNYWYYHTAKSSRFDKAVEDEYSTKVVCTRTVIHFVDPETNEEIDVSEVAREVYLVFISTKVGDNSLDKVEIQRLAVKLEWEENSSNLNEPENQEEEVVE